MVLERIANFKSIIFRIYETYTIHYGESSSLTESYSAQSLSIFCRCPWMFDFGRSDISHFSPNLLQNQVFMMPLYTDRDVTGNHFKVIPEGKQYDIQINYPEYCFVGIYINNESSHVRAMACAD